MHFPGQLALSLAPFHPLPPTRALITNFSVFPRNSRSLHHLLRVDTAFFRAFSSHSFSLAHPMGHIRLRFGPAQIKFARAYKYTRKNTRARKKTLRLSIFLSPLLEPLQVASRFRFLVERGAFFRPLPTTILQLFHAIIGVDRYTPALCSPLVFPRNRDPWLGAVYKGSGYKGRQRSRSRCWND